MSIRYKHSRLLNPQPYDGFQTGIVIGIDVGTMFSGVSYAFLRPGEIPEVQPVTRFTDQTSGDSKIPSIMYYDYNVQLKAAGASAVTESVIHEADFEGWTKVEHFKMHLRPANMDIDTHELKIGSLPSPMTATEVMGDFLRYLYDETIKFIEHHHTDGKELLQEVADHTTFVLSHPNGWSGLPQQRLRQAAILGGLIDDSTFGHDRLQFVTEGEASALACLAGGLCPANLEPGYRFIIADAGGGTLDMTSYEIIETSPLRLKELTSSDCRFAGSIFVNLKARELLKRRLLGSEYDNPEILDDIINDAFENTTKRQFKDAAKVAWLHVGSRSENDSALGIKRGSLRLDGTELAECFDFSVSQALKSVRQQIESCGGRPMPIWLVGGFGSSPWLLKKLKEGLKRDDIEVSRPDINLSKAVANGDVQYFLEHTVISRVTRATYGIVCSRTYSPSNPDHLRRAHLVYRNLNGQFMIPYAFSTIVKKNTEVQELYRATSLYFKFFQSMGEASSFSGDLYCYDGLLPEPEWYDENKELFRVACTIKADLSAMCRTSTSRMTAHSGGIKKFWLIKFEVEVMFGTTELQARVKWTDNGETKYGPATIFYEED